MISFYSQLEFDLAMITFVGRASSMDGFLQKNLFQAIFNHVKVPRI